MEKEAEQRRKQEEKKRKKGENQGKPFKLPDPFRDRDKKKSKHYVLISLPPSLPLHFITPVYAFPLQKPTEHTQYFGSALVKVVKNDGVPIFVRKCVDIIESGGIKSVGIYSLSGKREDCLTLKERFDQGQRKHSF